MPIIIRVAVIRVVRRPSLSWVPACQCPAKSVSVPRATVQVTVTVVLTAGPYRQVTELRCRCTAAAAVPRAGPGRPLPASTAQQPERRLAAELPTQAHGSDSSESARECGHWQPAAWHPLHHSLALSAAALALAAGRAPCK